MTGKHRSIGRRGLALLLAAIVVVSVVGVPAGASTVANEPPTVEVKYTPESPSIGESVQFTADASDPDGTVETYEWTVDGETVARGESFEHAFEEAGDHRVSVTVTDDDGETTSAEVVVTVETPNEPPTVEVSADADGQNVTVTAEFSDPEPEDTHTATILWGDGTSERAEVDQDANTLSATHTYAEDGDYEITVTVTDDDGAEGSANVTVSVGEGPNFDVTVDSTNSPVVEGETMKVSATVENVGDRPGNQTVTLSVGAIERDNVTVSLEGGESETVTLTWETGEADASNYTVQVATENDSDHTDVEVTEPGSGPPNFDVTVDSTNSPIEAGEKMTVTATVENTGDREGTQEVALMVGGVKRDVQRVSLGGGENTTVTLTWDTGEGDAGEYSAAVATPNDSAETDVTVEEPRGTNDPPTPGAIGFVPCDSDCDGDPVFVAGNDSMGQEELTIAFEKYKRTKLVAPDVNDPDGEVASYEWTVDGDPAGSGESVTVEFEEPGEHEVTLRVTDDEGATTTRTVIVDVNSPPTVDISASQSGNDVPPGQPFLRTETASFRAQAEDPDGSIEAYEWQVDGEVVSTSRKLDYTFEEPGEHEVVLVVTDDDGAETTVSRTVEVVERTATPTATSTPTDEPSSGPGFGIVVAIAALLVVALGSRRFSRQD